MHSGIQLQPRDVELLAALHECRVMTLAHIVAIHFDGHMAAAKKRVRRLENARLLGKRPRKAGEAALYLLQKEGWTLLRKQGIGNGVFKTEWDSESRRLRVSDLMLRHELAVIDAKATLFEVVRKGVGLDIVEFSTRPNRFQFKAMDPISGGEVLIKPDGYLRVKETMGDHESHFFLEVDRSTESLKLLTRRIMCYRNFYKRGGFAQRNGYDTSQYRSLPFRILVICKSRERCQHLISFLEDASPPVRTFAIVVTSDQLPSLSFADGNVCGRTSESGISIKKA